MLGTVDVPTTKADAVDYTEMFREWYPKAKSMARQRGLLDPEGSAQQALVTIWEKDYVSRWDPEGGCSLNTYVYRMVDKKLLDERRKQKRLSSHEIGNVFDGSPGYDEDDSDITVDSAYYEMGYEAAETALTYDALISALSQHDNPSRRASRSALLAAMVEMARSGIRPTIPDLSARFGVSPTTMRFRRNELIQALWTIPEAHELRVLFPSSTAPRPSAVEDFLPLSNRDLRPMVAEVLRDAGEQTSLSYYLAKEQKAALLAAVDNGDPIAEILSIARAAYLEHQRSSAA